MYKRLCLCYAGGMDLDKQVKLAAVGTFYLTLILVVLGFVTIYVISQPPPVPSKSLAAHPENTMPSVAWVFLGGMVLAGGLHVLAGLLQRQAAKLTSPRAMGVERDLPGSIERMIVTTPETTHTKDRPAEHIFQDDGRSFTDVSPKYLASLFTEYTSVQAGKLAEAYIGRLVRWSGTVLNVHENPSVSVRQIRVVAEVGSQTVVMDFSESYSDLIRPMR